MAQGIEKMIITLSWESSDAPPNVVRRRSGRIGTECEREPARRIRATRDRQSLGLEDRGNGPGLHLHVLPPDAEWEAEWSGDTGTAGPYCFAGKSRVQPTASHNTATVRDADMGCAVFRL